jgi:crossover junction endonuclease MUS81
MYIIPDSCLDYQTYLPLKAHLKEFHPARTYHISFLFYNELNSKSRNLTLRDTFAKMLMCTKGISTDKAAEIIKRYPTPHSFYTALIKCQNDETRWRMVNDVCGNTFGKKKIGPTVSERIAKLWFVKRYSDAE